MFFCMFLLILFTPFCNMAQAGDRSNGFVVDAGLSIEDAVQGVHIPKHILKNLILLDVMYCGFDQKVHMGQLVVNRSVASDLVEIFHELYKLRFPIEKVRPVVVYQWSDSLSMQDNNTSVFNYRKVAGSDNLSKHAYGKAIDINPYLNPYIKGTVVLPEGSKHVLGRQGTISDTSIVVKLFETRGWKWGGRWRSIKDYQHFEKD